MKIALLFSTIIAFGLAACSVVAPEPTPTPIPTPTCEEQAVEALAAVDGDMLTMRLIYYEALSAKASCPYSAFSSNARCIRKKLEDEMILVPLVGDELETVQYPECVKELQVAHKNAVVTFHEFIETLTNGGSIGAFKNQREFDDAWEALKLVRSNFPE